MNKNLFLIFILIILLCNIALAQQTETTVNDPNQLRQIFEFRQEGSGPIQLYKTIRGREISLGDVSGTITTDQLMNVIVRNGEYILVTEDTLATISGDFLITNPAQDKVYPNITLFNGTIKIGLEDAESRRTMFICAKECEHIILNPNTGNMDINGNATIFKSQERLADENITTASNIQVKPSKISRSVDVNLTFFVQEQQNNVENRIGKFKLNPGSKGEYTFKNKLHEITTRLITQEYISGDVHILELINPVQEILQQSQRYDLTLDVNNNELLKLKRGIIEYTDSDSFQFNCLSSRNPSCMFLNRENGNSLITLKGGTIIKINSDNGAISRLYIYPFQPQDRESKLILENPTLGNRKIIFTRDNVIVDGNWHDFGISFLTSIYNPSERRYDMLECKFDENQCYINGRLITLREPIRHLARCNQNTDCNNNAVCRTNRCVEAGGCRMIMEGDSNDPLLGNNINVFFVGDGIYSFSEVERIARWLVNTNDGLFGIEPFKSNKEKFNILIKPSPPARVGTSLVRANEIESDLPLFNEISENNQYAGFNSLENEGFPIIDAERLQIGQPDIESLDISDCPEADIKIIVSKRSFRSNANLETKVCKLSLPTETQESLKKFVHEFGHCFGGLADEYHIIGIKGHPLLPNCIAPNNGKSTEEIALEEWTRLIKQEIFDNKQSEGEARNLVNSAMEEWRGCGGDCDSRCNNYLRPSENSIMNKYFMPSDEAGEFNRISRLHQQEKINANTIIG